MNEILHFVQKDKKVVQNDKKVAQKDKQAGR